MGLDVYKILGSLILNKIQITKVKLGAKCGVYLEREQKPQQIPN